MSLSKTIALLFIALFIAISFSGCATLFANKSPQVSIGSDPDGAKVYVNGSYMGVSPVRVRLKNTRDYTIEFRKDGYQPRTYFLDKHLGGGWLVLDILTGFWPIDLATGNWFLLDSHNVRVLLDK